MEIIKKTGCTIGLDIEVDGKEFKKLSLVERKNVWNRCLNNLVDDPRLESNDLDLFERLLELFDGEYSWSEPCEQCGDIVETQTINI